MLKRLRRNLTFTFILISLLIYATVIPVGIMIFAHGLNSSVDGNLWRLSSDIQPSIDYIGRTPSLKSWAQNAADLHLHLPNTVQLFDDQQTCIEAYGPAGVTKLVKGALRADPRGRHKSIRSQYVKLSRGGFLQVQVDTEQVDQAITQFVLTMFLLMPILLAITGACGWFYAGKAVKPVARSMHVLRRFVADAAHELKTPATIIDASTQTLEELVVSTAQTREIMDVLSRASQRLRKLAEDLVYLARMESPELSLQMQVFSLDELISQINEDFSEVAKDKQVSLDVPPLPAAKMYGNATALSRVLINLVDNAMRYTEPGGKVTLALEEREGSYTITVQDTGIGIPRASLPHIFDRFYRVDESRARAVGGTGLGLSIVQAIVEAHEGIITVSSEEGKGTKFTIVVPSRMLPTALQADAQKSPKPLTSIKK